MRQKKASFFINLKDAHKLVQMKGLETTILTGLHGEKMMMVFNTTQPGHTVSLHSHPHEQVGMVYSGRARLRIGDEERMVKKGIFTVFQLIFLTAISVLAVSRLSCWIFSIQ